ncbi:MAG: UvrD-helicase domain-containing protein [Acidobacteria bacterium]|nr:UvrD-helicase domain-containing protein [Acidobacteriota bacterium]
MSAISDAPARAHAVDPARNVVLEASAGTGKTRVLVERYVNLLRAGVEPDHILAITFTRKAAAEMRERIIDRLREAARLSEFDAGRWRELKERLGEIAISTIDAFCLSLLREFPLEADVDPGFDLADDTEVPRLIGESLDQALRICRGIARDDDDVALVFAQLGERRLRTGLAALLDRRLVAPQALRRYLARGPKELTAAAVCRRAAERLRDTLSGVSGGLEPFLQDGPVEARSFSMLASDMRALCCGDGPGSHAFEARDAQAHFRVLADRLRGYFLKADGEPRGASFMGTGYSADECVSPAAWKRHRAAAGTIAPAVAETLKAFRRDLNVVLSRGVWRIFAVALDQYQQTLEGRALLDFSGVLERAVKLLKDMDEFAQSRFRLEARYRHVLVDEFQDTSRAQWQLVAQLVRNWGEGFGASSDAIQPSIFIVGDRKQSIYGFRDADVSVLDDAAVFVADLRGEDDPRRAISVSFRSDPAILGFINDVFGAVDKVVDRPDRFRYDEADRFPLADVVRAGELQSGAAQVAGSDGERERASGVDRPVRPEPPLGLIVGATISEAAQRVAGEVARVIGRATVRDRAAGVRRVARAGDIAVLFRSRDTHREFEKALAAQGVPTYVYKGLGFFESDEVQDAVALLRFLADPQSNLRAAALLRSRIVRISDGGMAALAPALADALTSAAPPTACAALDEDDRRMLTSVREALPRWLSLVDRLAPSELLSVVLAETAHAFELRGARYRQARENLKKLRAMVRRYQNRGYATLARLADHIDQLAVGDESNAAIDAEDAVSLMTVHASKGLEFPIVFVVNMGRGTGNMRAPIRVAEVKGEPSVAIADYQSEADEDTVAREREETKRLLYVALTRARDRLYLSGSVSNGQFRPTRGALAEVLPDSLKVLFVAAAGAVGPLSWAPDGAGVHELVVPEATCAAAGPEPSAPIGA